MIKKIVIGIAAFLVIIIVIVAIQDQSSPPSPPPVSPSSTTESTAGEQSTDTTSQQTMFQPITITGSGDKTSPPFTVTTAEWIIDWSYSCDDPEFVVFWVFIYPRGETASYIEGIWAAENQTSGSTYSYAGPAGM